jgi:hypothetical protein
MTIVTINLDYVDHTDHTRSYNLLVRKPTGNVLGNDSHWTRAENNKIQIQAAVNHLLFDFILCYEIELLKLSVSSLNVKT